MNATAEPTDPEERSSVDASSGVDGLTPTGDRAGGQRQRVNPPDPDLECDRTVGHDQRAPSAARAAGTDGAGTPATVKGWAGGLTGPDGSLGKDGRADSPAVASLRMAVRSFDRWAERPFTHLRGNKPADRLFYGASEAANFSMLWHAMAWAPVLLRPSRHRLIRAVGTSGSLAVESVLVNGPVKSAFRRTRPVLEQGHLHVHHLRTPRSTSFPSGHASAAVVAAMVMGRDRHRLVRWLLVAAATVVSASRVHVRIHHPSDVVGGALIGWLLGRVLRRLLP